MSSLKIEIELPRREKRARLPRCWSIYALMTPWERELLEPQQRPAPLGGAFGPSIYGFPVRWR
jgi:hypothetical protein